MESKYGLVPTRWIKNEWKGVTMKKKVIVLLLASILSTNCGLAKQEWETKYNQTKEVAVSGEQEPLMKLLLSALILYSLNLVLHNYKKI